MAAVPSGRLGGIGPLCRCARDAVVGARRAITERRRPFGSTMTPSPSCMRVIRRLTWSCLWHRRMPATTVGLLPLPSPAAGRYMAVTCSSSMQMHRGRRSLTASVRRPEPASRQQHGVCHRLWLHVDRSPQSSCASTAGASPLREEVSFLSCSGRRTRPVRRWQRHGWAAAQPASSPRLRIATPSSQ